MVMPCFATRSFPPYRSRSLALEEGDSALSAKVERRFVSEFPATGSAESIETVAVVAQLGPIPLLPWERTE